MQTVDTTPNPLEKSIDLTVAPDWVASEMDARLKKLSKRVKVDGFRPGKVPLRIVAQQYGGQVEQEVLGDALGKQFGEAVREQKLKVAGYPRFAAKQVEGSDQYQFTATFEVYPEIKLGDVSGSSVTRPTTEVGEADIDRTIEVLRKQRSTFKPADKAAAAGDLVNINYVGRIDGVAFEGGTAENYRFVLGEGRLMKDFEDAVTGLKKGESKTFPLAFPEDYHGKDVAGKTAEFEITLNEVSESVLPEVDADFAKSLGVVDGDVAKMREEVKANLARELKKRIDGRIKEQVMQVLLDTTKIDIPRVLVAAEIEQLQERARNDLQTRGMAAKDIPLPADLFEEQAKRRVTLGLILAELVQAHKLTASPEKVRAMVEDYAQSFEQPAEVIKWYYSEPSRLAEVESLALEENVVEWMLGQVKVTDEAVDFNTLMGNA